MNTVSGVFVLFSKKAIQAVGGWDIDMITEDIAISWKMHLEDWLVIYEPRALCYMIAPDTLGGLFKQRIRWAQGGQEVVWRDGLKVIKKGNIPFILLLLEQLSSILWSVSLMLTLLFTSVNYLIQLEYDIPATGFVITGQVGNQNFNSISLMDLESLVELDESGLWSFGLHTDDLHYLDEHNNSALLAASDQTVKKDTKKSQDYLDKYLENCRTDAIAYPYGQMNDQTQVSLAEQGVRYGFTLEEKAIHNPINDFYIPRVLVSQESFERLVKSWQGFQ